MLSKRMIRGKRGLSPVIATVLLIGIVIVMALIVFFWIKGINEEAITKFEGDKEKNVKIICEDIEFDADYNAGNLLISNRGNVPIYKMKAKLSGGGSHETLAVEGEGSFVWPTAGLYIGDSGKVSLETGSYDTMLLIPVLAGKSSEGTKTYTCDDQFGYEISL